MFSEVRVAQMAAYILNLNGGSMNLLKLMKLLYLADRESMDRYGEPISDDHMVSMPHGPVLSQTLNLINGGSENGDDGWNGWVSDRANHTVASMRPDAAQEEFDELSEADMEILRKVYNQFRHMEKFQLVEYTHINCTEWQDPNGSSFPINPEAVFRALGKSEETSVAMANHLRERRQLDAIVATLR